MNVEEQFKKLLNTSSDTIDSDLFLKNRGNFCCKIIGGGETDNFIKKLKIKFKTVKVFKPISSRKESAEIFLVGLNYRQGIVE